MALPLHPLAAARRHPDPDSLTFPAQLARSLDLSPDLPGIGAATPERLLPWARNGGTAYVHISDDAGHTFPTTIPLDTTPFAGGYNMRGAIVLPDNRLLLPLCDIPAYERVYVMHSSDRGLTWSRPTLVAAEPNRLFEEPCALTLPDGRILMLLRENRSRHLWQVTSSDAGATWSKPVPTPIAGYPAHLLLLPDHRILCTYGHRTPDFSIRAVVASGDGPNWGLEPALVIRGGLPNRDLGYPVTLLHPDRRLTTIYYALDPDGVTCIQATTFRLPE
jgi:hypothetical protein